MSLEGLRWIALTPERVEDAVALSTEAGWNQVPADWAWMLGRGDAYGVVAPGGRLVASGLTVRYPGGFAWISMILVTADHQRRGLATELMRHCIASIEALGLTPALDASPQGREVYRKLAFRDDRTITRLVGRIARTPVETAGFRIRAIEDCDMPALVAYDASAAGSERAALLHHLRSRRPQAALLAERDGAIAGYVLARDGRRCAQLGPVVAEDAATAIALLAGAGLRAGAPVCLDLGDRHEAVRRWLDRCGFRPATRFFRMIRGHPTALDDDARVAVIAGPELG